MKYYTAIINTKFKLLSEKQHNYATTIKQIQFNNQSIMLFSFTV